SFVRPPIQRRRRQGNLQRIPDLARDRIFACSRMNAHTERYASVIVLYRNHANEKTRRNGPLLAVSRSGSHSLCPKIAVPTRTHVDPSSIATSKSCDMPIESTSMSIDGSFLAAISSRNSRNFLK